MAFIQLPGFIVTPPLSDAGEARIRYNDSTKDIEASIDGGAYLPIGDGGVGGGDMFKATYDPTGVNGDAFDMANMVDNIAGAGKLALTNAERLRLVDFGGAGFPGVVPDPGVSTGLFLRDDGTFAAGTGEINLGANVGGGAGEVFRDKTGVTINFKTLVNGAGIGLTNGADTITLTSTISPGPLRYVVGTAIITANALGVTYVSAAGVGTITIPPGVILSSIRINGTAAELAAGTFIVRLVDAGATFNQSEATALYPAIRYIDRAGIIVPGAPSAAAPYPARPIGGGLPTIQCEGLNGTGSAPVNGVDWVVGAMPPSDWTLMVNL